MNGNENQGDEIAFFNRASEGWSKRYSSDASFVQRRKRIMDAVVLNVAKARPLLDFGCGAGDLSIDAIRAGYNVVGADAAAGMCEQARLRIRDEGVEPQVVALDTGTIKLPFEDAAFGGCMASSVLEYVPDVDGTLSQLSRVLVPGGRLVMTVPNMESPIRRKEKLMKTVLLLPFAGRLLQLTRWREGAAYLAISRNRGSLAWWEAHLRQVGLNPLRQFYDNRVAGGALVLIVAEKNIAA